MLLRCNNAVQTGVGKGIDQRGWDDTSAVAATKGPSRTPAKAGKRLTKKNGNAGTNRRNNR